VRLRLTLCAIVAVARLPLGLPAVRADYVVLRSGARLNVTGLRVAGRQVPPTDECGLFAESPASDVLASSRRGLRSPCPKR